MDERIIKGIATTNVVEADPEAVREYVDGAPHIKHASLRNLYSELVIAIYDLAATYTSAPKVLDLGCGDGLMTLSFLKLGASVTAVDISESRLDVLQSKCACYPEKLEVHCRDVFDALRDFQSGDKRYDIIVANSFLHHIPDYLGFVCQAVEILSPWGQFFSFRDLLRYDSLSRFTLLFSTIAYASWRVFKGDVIKGVKRRMRRYRGIYLDECPADNVEYHVVRNGVDQDAIRDLRQLGLECKVIRYFSTQSRLWQLMGTALGVDNTFGIVGGDAVPVSC